MPSPEDGKESQLGKNNSAETEIRRSVHYPWRRLNRAYDSRGFIGLHQEIEDFFKCMTPTIEEHTVRLVVVNRIKTLVYKLWPRAFVEVFGSFATGLYLPTSDIDLVVCGNWNNPPLYVLKRALIECNISKPEHIKVLDKTIVPIIKLTDQSSNLKLDISFNMQNAVRSVQVIKDFSYRYPALSKLAFVLKQFLFQRNLNEVFNGGISSYSLILMIISFLQLHPRKDSKRPEENLGILLIEFFELYGRKFDYEENAIRIKMGGSLISKDKLLKDAIEGHKPTTLCIEDPLTPGNDVGCGSYGTVYAKKEFELAFLILKSTISSTNASDANVQSILGRIVAVSDDVIKYRNWVRENSLPIMNAMPLKQNCGREVKSMPLLPSPKSSIGSVENRPLSWRNHSNNTVADNKRDVQPNFQRRNLVRAFIVPQCQTPLIPNPPLLQTPILLPHPSKCFVNNKYANTIHQNHCQRVFYNKNVIQPKIEADRHENYFFPHPPALIPFYSLGACDAIFKPVGFTKNHSKYHQNRLSAPSPDFLVAAW